MNNPQAPRNEDSGRQTLPWSSCHSTCHSVVYLETWLWDCLPATDTKKFLYYYYFYFSYWNVCKRSSSSKPFWFHDHLLTFFLHSQTKWTRNSSKNPFLFKRTAVEWFRCMTDRTCVVCGFVFLSQQLLLTFVINGKLTMRAERREAKMPPCWRELEGVCSCISVRWYFMMY